MLPILEAEPVRQLSLTVHTSDSQSEIIVLDSRGRLLQRSFGPQQTFTLDRGIYRVRVLTGSEFQEKSIALSGAPGDLQFPELAFASPVPLAGTTTSHEYHMDAANRESRAIHVADGAGSSLFFFVRDWTPPSETARHRITGNPAEGLSLYAVSANGERRICDLAKSGTTNAAGDPWAACSIEVNPGVYELRLELPGRAAFRQSFVASPGWQTQAFVFMRAYSTDDGPQWRADLSRTSVLLSQAKGFSPSESMLRVTELARMALATKRPVTAAEPGRSLMPSEMRTLLREKFVNPILGIYGAHLLLMEASIDFALLGEVVRNLRMLVSVHPDVEALALRVPGEPPPLPFEHPPMLRRSWSLIVDASVTRPLILADSLAARDMQESSEGPWHIWCSLPEAIGPGADPISLELSDIESAVAEDLGVMKHVRRKNEEASRRSEHWFLDAFREPKQWVEGLADKLASRGMYRPPAPENVELHIDDARMRSIAARFGMPSPQLKRTLTSLEGKLTLNPGAPNLKVDWK